MTVNGLATAGGHIAKIAHILENAAKSSAGCKFYTQCACEFSGQDAKSRTLSYAQLLSLAKEKAHLVASLAREHRQQSTSSRHPIVLLHFDSMEDNIVWFWATILAGLKPAVSTPLPSNVNQRKKHLAHVAILLENPLVLSTDKLLPELSDSAELKVSTVERLSQEKGNGIPDVHSPQEDNSPTILLLTSGSSGNAKAVELGIEQILASVSTKAEPRQNVNDVYLNWIGFDHVAAVVESHIRAMYLAVDQIHVPAGEVISQPWRFLSLIKEHRVSVTFAPHFFLARLLQAVENTSTPQKGVDVSSLHRIDSGGEAVTIWVVDRLMKALRPFGARENLIRPVFGMTETCAGCIYNYNCPEYDIPRNSEFAALGTPIEGLEVRIVKDDGQLAKPNELGVLQLSGKVVFKRYYNNPIATTNSFSKDGWFITGDKAYLDENGNLCLSGRDKETINLNGVKYEPFEIEAALELEELDQTGITPSFTSVFSVRPHNATSEEICVLYHPQFAFDDSNARIRASDAIVRIVGTRTRTRPKHIIPLPQDLLPKSALGKLSRAKLRDAFEKGDFREYEDRLNPELKEKREVLCEAPTTDTERLVLREVSAILGSTFEDLPLGINNSIFDFGVTSTDLFVLAKYIQSAAGLNQSIPVGTLLTDPTVHGIASAVDQLGNEGLEYIPLVPLQKEGSKTPLFLIHPGSGDVLAFVALAKYFPDRPVYGIRTKSLYSGNDYFKTVHEMADCYYAHIKNVQPKGPYAIAGYSLGSSVAFEIAKMLEREGESIPFVGALDSPPYIRELICDLKFVDVLLDVAYFLELITEEYAMAELVSFSQKSDDEALDIIMSRAPPDRLKMLSIDKPRLRQITQVTDSFGRAAASYKPEGMISGIDVLWVTPLLWVASTREEWMKTHLSKWVEFSKEAPRFHECEGLHSKMLNDDYVDGIAKKLRAAIQARGL